MLGRLGEFTSPTALTRCLEGAPAADDWAASAAAHVTGRLSS